MVKRTIKETVREYDTDGRLLKETVTETSEDDDTVYYPSYAPNIIPAVWGTEVTCDTQYKGGSDAEGR